MDSVKIFIDTDTEIPFVIEKILTARTERVAVVVPDRAALMSSIVGLKLIKRVVDKSKKLVAIVTLDAQGAELAQKAGLKVVARVGEINSDIWDELLRQKFEFSKKNSHSYYLDKAVVEKAEEAAVLSEQPAQLIQPVQTTVVIESEETKPEVPVISIELESERVSDQTFVQESPEKVEDILLVSGNNEVDLINDEAKPLPTFQAQGNEVKRVRKVAPGVISNLTFTVGKDIAEKKKFILPKIAL